MKMKYSSQYREKKAQDDLSALKADLENMFQKDSKLNTQFLTIKKDRKEDEMLATAKILEQV